MSEESVNALWARTNELMGQIAALRTELAEVRNQFKQSEQTKAKLKDLIQLLDAERKEEISSQKNLLFFISILASERYKLELTQPKTPEEAEAIKKRGFLDILPRLNPNGSPLFMRLLDTERKCILVYGSEKSQAIRAEFIPASSVALEGVPE